MSGMGSEIIYDNWYTKSLLLLYFSPLSCESRILLISLMLRLWNVKIQKSRCSKGVHFRQTSLALTFQFRPNNHTPSPLRSDLPLTHPHSHVFNQPSPSCSNFALTQKVRECEGVVEHLWAVTILGPLHNFRFRSYTGIPLENHLLLFLFNRSLPCNSW